MKNKKVKHKPIKGISCAIRTYYASGGEFNQLLKVASTEWLIELTQKMKNPWSVLLTYKNPISTGMPTERNIINAEQWLNKNFEKLVQDLSMKAYASSYKKHKKTIKAVGSFEYSFSNNRFHIHAIIDVPQCHDPEKSYDLRFANDIKRFWKKYGRVEEAKEVTADLKAGISKEESLERLCRYISKLRTKKTASGSYTDALLIKGY